jgi:hypothetical protein
MFLAGTLGIIIGGPFAYIVGSFYPEVALSNGEVVEIHQLREVGGGANQTAMLEVFGASKSMFAQMIAVDVLPIYGWGFTLWSSKIR